MSDFEPSAASMFGGAPPPDDFDSSDERTKEGQKIEHKRELRERLITIIRVVSGHPKMTVTTDIDPITAMQLIAQGQNPDQTWFRQTKHDPKTQKVIKEIVHIPEEIVESTENVAKGKAAHEAGHVAITRMGEFIPAEVMQRPGFRVAISSAEERATDQVIRDRFKGAGKWVDEARKDNVSAIAGEARKRLGTIPKFLQLCDLIVHEPHLGEIIGDYDPDVVQEYERIRADIEQLEASIPEVAENEKAIVKRAKDRYRITYKKIWPAIRRLFETDLEQEAVRQIIDQVSQPPDGEGDFPIPRVVDDLPPELRKEIARAIEKLNKQTEDSQQKPDTEGPDGETEREEEVLAVLDKLPPELQQEIRQTIKGLEAEAPQKLSTDEDPKNTLKQLPTKQRQAILQDLEALESDLHKVRGRLVKGGSKKTTKDSGNNDVEQWTASVDQLKTMVTAFAKQAGAEQARSQRIIDRLPPQLQKKIIAALEELRKNSPEKPGDTDGEDPPKKPGKKGQPQDPQKPEEPQPPPTEPHPGDVPTGPNPRPNNPPPGGDSPSDDGPTTPAGETLAPEGDFPINPRPDGKHGPEGQPPKSGKPGGETARPSNRPSAELLKDDEGLAKKIQKAMERLSPEKLRALQERAKKVLQETEKKIADDLSGKLIDQPDHPPRPLERDPAAERMQERIAELQKQVEQQTMPEIDIEIYEKVYQEIRATDEELYRRLEEIFHPNLKRGMKLRTAGPHLNLPAVYKWTVSRANGQIPDNKIFERIEQPKKRDYAITLLVDLSGSMQEGDKIEETFKGAILLAEVLNRLGVAVEITGFNTRVTNFKRFDEAMTDVIRSRMTGMLAEVESNFSGATYTSMGIEAASKALEQRPAKNKFLLVMTDGQPSGADDLIRTVKKVNQQTQQSLIGIGLGQGTEYVKDFFPAAIPNVRAEQLPSTLGDLLEELVKNPQAFRVD